MIFSRELTIISTFSDSSTMTPPVVTFVNATEVKVTWDTTNFHKGGPQIIYEVKIVHHQKQNAHILRTNSSGAKSNFVMIALDKISDDKVSVIKF